MAKLTTGIVDNQPGHAALHNEERSAHNVNDDRITTAQNAATAAQAKADAAYVKSATGIPEADLDSAVATKLAGNARGTASNPIDTTTEKLPTNLRRLWFELPEGSDHPGRRAGDYLIPV